MIRAVVDTNILIRSAIRPQGTVGSIARRLRDGGYTLVFSGWLFDELIGKLSEARIRVKYHLDQQSIQDYVGELAVSGELIIPTRRIKVCRDADDNHVLEAAVEGEAQYIVTSDEDLLVLDPFEGIRIVLPHVFLATLE